MRVLLVAMGLFSFLAIASCNSASKSIRCPDVAPAAGPTPDPSAPVLVGAGDIADCTRCAESTAAQLDSLPGTVFMAGDAAYPDGSADDFERCYEPTWGRHKARTRPAPGNHEYKTEDAAGYFGYFGVAAGTAGQGWYSYDLGGWHVVVLNSNCGDVGCEPGSPQLEWLEADLAASTAACTAAVFHHPRWSSGRHGNDDDVAPFWDVLYEHGAEVVLNGHDHTYERMMPVAPDGTPDAAYGIREFVVGTGGVDLYRWSRGPLEITEIRDNDTYGVLRLDLRADGYDWAFLPADPEGFTDTGTASCHGPPP